MVLLLLLKQDIKKILLIIIFYLLSIFFIENFSLSSNNKKTETSFKKGISIYKKANCSSCHFWHAEGGNSHGGAAASLRTTDLSYKELLKIIKCGRPGTNMPYFSRNALNSDDCMYSKKSVKELEEITLKGSKLLNSNEIKSLAKFIENEIKNKPLTKKYCLEFFKREENCNKYHD